ncbi:MAG: ABC transporter permease [Erysipelotrichaceae bacterium]|nr:ABC transporter permease [Erysipelotrichaceae bacterium]
MNFLKRAFLSLVRRKGKSLILLVIIFILSNVMAGSIAIGQASKNVERTIKLQLGANASVELDWEKMQDWTEEQWNSLENITPETADKIGTLSYVKYYDYSSETYINSSTLTQYDPNMVEVPTLSYFPIKGVQYAPILDIVNGNATLVNGRTFNETEITNADYVALISDKVAELNNVFVGDVIYLQNTFSIWKEDNTVEEIKRDIALEVIGIFTPKVEQSDENNGGWIDYTPFNRIYVPNGVVHAENRWMNEQYAIAYPDSNIKIDQIYITPTFVLNNPEDVESFRTEAKNLLPDYYKVTVSSDAYDSVAGPIKFIGSLSNIILYVAIGATILILSLVVILFLRDRKHELGIYLSLGESKSKVVGQILIEVVSIALIAITLSLLSGNSIAESTSKSMMDLRNEITGNTDNGGVVYRDMGYNPTNGVTEEDVLEAYKIEFSWDYVLILYGVGLGTVLLSSIAPMIYILRLKPKKIMM